MGEFNRVPSATYRLQFNRDFTFEQATEIVDYLKELGISDLYASPLFQAGPESTHGYDICQFEKLNANLGSENDFEKLTGALQKNRMELLLDMVPNHMGGHQSNCWWNDVLKKGEASSYARFFDINWNPENLSLKGKVLLPVLGAGFAEVLERGDLKLVFEGADFFITYFDKRFPVAPESLEAPASLARVKEILAEYNGISGDPKSWDALDRLIRKQHYRLASWRVAREEINYRRFFDVTELVSIRVEDEEVFKASHRLVFELLSSGKVTGLRIDHPDGLKDPWTYFDRLQQYSRKEKKLFVIVEKILSDEEKLPGDWPVAGTTGYDFLNVLNGVFVNQENAARFNEIYEKFTGRNSAFEPLGRECKKLVLEKSLASELCQLATRLKRIAEQSRYGRDCTYSELRSAIVEFIAAFPVYRTYIREGTGEPSERDRRYIEETLSKAKRLGGNAGAIDFLGNLLLLRNYSDFSGELATEAREFVLRFQQLSGPATAKGLEDTAFYRFNRLVSLNEVGGNPGKFGCSVEEFHRYNNDTAKNWPHAQLASATHDTKRGEDARARINVLSEIPEIWEANVRNWSEIAKDFSTMLDGEIAPCRNDEYLIYQTLVGSWTTERSYEDRLKTYLTKATREAKERTNWTDPNAKYEQAVHSFIERLIKSEEFLKSFVPFQKTVSEFGWINSLAQVLIKIFSPGFPDFYQGTELWDFNLVDPDNRRPVDYKLRKELLEKIKSGVSGSRPLFLKELSEHHESGAIKMFAMRMALGLRNENPQVFRNGKYTALKIIGGREKNVIAFTRTLKSKTVALVTPRLLASAGVNVNAITGGFWADTKVELPSGAYRNVFTETIAHSNGTCACADLFDHFPVCILESGATNN